MRVLIEEICVDENHRVRSYRLLDKTNALFIATKNLGRLAPDDTVDAGYSGVTLTVRG